MSEVPDYVDGVLEEGERRRVLDQVDIWRKQLINLARSNRLLYFRHTRTSTLEVVGEHGYLANVVATLLAGRDLRFYLPAESGPGDDRADGEPTAGRLLPVLSSEISGGAEPGPNELVTSKKTARELRSALRTLDRRATQEFMDKGIWILYLAVGMLRWTDPDYPERAESPLVLVPVQLHRGSPREPYELRRVDEDVMLNPALVVKLAEFGLELPVVDEEDLDFTRTLDALERTIADRHGWSLERRLVISPFSFHKDVMYRDLVTNEEAVAAHPLVQALAVGAKEGLAVDFDVVPEDRLDQEVPPEETVTILDADASQMQCIAAATAGRSFVMDGPPGTGKSQTIANIIAELLAKGRSVLFVSEKAAALDVVHKRLWAAGLGDYCLELHSHKATRKEVAQQFGRALELHPALPSGMAETSLAQLRRRRQELSDRAASMNEIRQPLGRSLHDVLGRVSELHGLPQAPPPAELGSTLSAEELTAILSAAGEIARAWGPVSRGSDFVWRDLADVVLDSTRAQRTRSQIGAASAQLERLVRTAAEAAEVFVLRAPDGFEATQALARVLRHLESRPASVPSEWLSCPDLEDVETLVQSRRQLVTAHGRAEKALLEGIGSSWREVSEPSVSQLAAALEQLRSLDSNFELRDSLPVWQLASLLALVAETRSLAEAAHRDGESIAISFGLPTSGLTLKRAAELAELALLAGEPVRPEPAWINPAVITGVEQAARTLQPLCTSFRERRALLGEVFTDDVLDLDLESLCHRFLTVHRGLGKLGSAYRLDKQTVARATRAGKATKEVIAWLPQALEWQRLTSELRAAETRQAELLGTYYYQSTASDFDAIGRALENARRAIEIAGEHLNIEAMRRQLARGSEPDPTVLPVAAGLRDSIEGWRSRASFLLDTFERRLVEMDLPAVTAWCVAVTGPLGDLAAIASEVEGVAGRPINLDELVQWLEARGEVGRIESALVDSEEDDRRKLGAAYRVLETNWDAVEASIDWATELRALLGGPAGAASAERLASVELDWRELDAALDRWRGARDDVVGNFLEERAVEICSDLGTTFADSQELLDYLGATVGDIDEWVEFQKARQTLVQSKVGAVIEFCESSRVSASELPEVVERACLERWSDALIEEDWGRLRQVRADQLDPLVGEFRQLDRQLVQRSGRRVVEACNARRPRTTIGAAGTIKREAEKRSRHMPIRKLLEETAEVAQLLKPCFMMTPLTVSQFLPPSLRFDAVLFDEASQVRPSDAINCVYRGKQLVIAGDDMQLPPTSFFEAVSVDGDDEWAEDQFEDFESVIKLGKGSGGLRELPLRWHYRSQHEDLITYSNFSFYDGRLVTFPGSRAEAIDLGVKFFHVEDGVYRRGTARDNPKEAEVVVDRVLYWAKRSVDSPSEGVTLGVVAFSEAQADAIEAALDRRRQALPELDEFFAENRLDGFFVKNLENVQGDERDVMIFSIGYGRDELGKLTMNFGPLNRQGGERRLNVAITRARRRVELVASITGTEAEFATSLADGARQLQRYLDYAARGPVALAIDVGDEMQDAESPFEEEVMRTIRSWGYQVKPQVGTAGYRVDIGVWHPAVAGRFALGVECDGSMYHSSRVARDRDRLRQQVLEGLGWRLYRVWGTSWYRHRSEDEQRLRAAIEAAVRGERESAASAPPRPIMTTSDESERFEPVSLDMAPSWTVPYRLGSPIPPRYRVDMHLPEALPELQRMILEVVEVEGPIEDELLLRRVREAWGVGRAGHRVRANFDSALAGLLQRRHITRLEPRFTYVRPEQLRFVRVSGDDAKAVRNVAQVSRHELMAAIKHLVDEARRVSRDELTFEVCRLFGWNRRGSDIMAALEEAVDSLIRQSGLLLEEGGFLKGV